VDDGLWQAVKTRYAGVQKKWNAAEPRKRFNQFVRPKYFFTGMTKCGECGLGFVVYYRDQLGCFGTRDRGSCTNKLTISRQEVEERMLHALQEKLLRKDCFDRGVLPRVRQGNESTADGTAGQSERRKARTGTREPRDSEGHRGYQGRVPAGGTEAGDGLPSARKEQLVAQLSTADEPPPLLHPSMADLYRTKVEELAAALQRDDTRLEASDMLRWLIESIVLIPDGDQLRIGLQGNLAARLAAAQKTTMSPGTGDLLVPIQLVAGARSQRYKGTLVGCESSQLTTQALERRARSHQSTGSKAFLTTSLNQYSRAITQRFHRIGVGHMRPWRAASLHSPPISATTMQLSLRHRAYTHCQQASRS